uniref:Integrase core domain containing protein n=1 Tax=Solanum tuberosum TaxID=4113 RepID=M1DAI6_SOLTU
MRWIAGYIATEREAVARVSDLHVLITKASLTFSVEVWWSIVRAQLRPTANDNTLSPSLASLVTYLMVGYLVNAGCQQSSFSEKIRSGGVGPLAVVPHTPVVIPQVAGQTEHVLASASGSETPVTVSGSQPDPALVSESAPVDKDADTNPDIGT